MIRVLACLTKGEAQRASKSLEREGFKEIEISKDIDSDMHGWSVSGYKEKIAYG